ncbi:MAG: hypothetical protein V1869_03890 [Candidatus Omnitrophota bacterium]
MQKNDFPGAEQRKYVRLDTVFPVQFSLLTIDGKINLSGPLQGFTNNLSSGGICLCVNNLELRFAQMIKEHQAKFSLMIDIPFLRKPIGALALPVWVKVDTAGGNKYYIGLLYEVIEASANHKLMSYARRKKFFVPVVLGVVIFLGALLALNSFMNIKLTEENRALVRELTAVIRESGEARRQISGINKEKLLLESNIKALESRIKGIDDERLKLENRSQTATGELREQSRKIGELNSRIKQLTAEKEGLKSKLAVTRMKEGAISKEIERIDKKKAVLERANFEAMYQWIRVHQNPRTGLVMSFEGDSDISGWAFTYDQSLVIQAFTNFSDFQRAKKILDFFNNRAQKKDGLFLNAYYADDGAPAEYVIHCGPNIWLGIAAVQYSYKAHDRTYLDMAESIADGVINLQGQDSEGGLRGGPGVTWYSTEHNLDAYAFFDMLYTLTNKQKYLEARDKVLDWLVKNTYSRTGIPIKRGKGDSTIATDTYAWSIAAIGPDKLESLGMDPDKIMDFAEKTCGVNVCYKPPGRGKVQIQGFDFAPQRHVSRGGVISSEWTAQMIISFKIMADYYLRKGVIAKENSYRLKAEEYLLSLSNMIICSPSASGQGANCLPYASLDFVDTGHGWFTPKGKDTGSVSGTTYTIFAYYNYNPLKLKD